MVAFVTGGAVGIGREIALTFAEKGYDIAISYMSSKENAEKVVSQIEAMGRKAIMIKADISKYDDILNMFDEFKNHFDTIDVFINNAGVTEKAPFLETTEKTFDNICNVDFKGAFFCMQQTAKIMIEHNTKGSIIVISSNNAIVHFADVSVYGSVKTAVNKLAEHAAIELAKYKIRVNAVAPGWTDTGAARLDAKEETYYKIPLNQWATTREISEACIYLSSPAASSITGATLVIDNGASLVSDKRERYGF